MDMSLVGAFIQLDILNGLEKRRKKIKQLWFDIANFETNERKNESDNILLSEARAGARMESYVKLFGKKMEEVYR